MSEQPHNSFRGVDPITGDIHETLMTEEQARQLLGTGSTAGWVQDDQAEVLVDDNGRITYRDSWVPPESD